MYCKKCGAALPSHGYTCKFCGAMFDSDQIKQQKEYNKDNKKNFELNLISDKYNNGINREYKTNKDNKVLGAIIIILILVLLIIVGILKVL